MNVKKHRALALFAVLALAACSGKDGAPGRDGANGADGVNGTNGVNGINGVNGKDLTSGPKAESCEICHPRAGAEHQALYNNWVDGLGDKTAFAVTLDPAYPQTSAGTNAGTFKSTIRFKLLKNGQPYTAGIAGLKQKTIYFATVDANGKFVTPAYLTDAQCESLKLEAPCTDASSPVNFTYGGWKLIDAATGLYEGTRDNLSADPLTAATNAFVYGYFGDTSLTIPANYNTSRHYALMDNMISFAKVLKGGVPDTSTVDVKGCEKCHGKPYSKHGYRQAVVAGLPDFAACKACHTDSRKGSDAAWYLLVDDPAAYATQEGELTGTVVPPSGQKGQYLYTANLMNDTHNSHAFEFAYPQSMSNCTTCHAGKLDAVLMPANFTAATCKSCHPVKGVGGTSDKRAPSFAEMWTDVLATVHPAVDTLYTGSPDCQLCHGGGGVARTLKEMHPGYNKQIYASPGVKYATTIEAKVDSATFDKATNKATVQFSIGGTGLNASAIVQPHVVVSLYGYDSKDFVVSGHNSQSDGTYNLEFYEGAKQRSDATKSANSARLQIDPPAAAAGVKAWTATVDLSLWASKIADGSVKRFEIAVLPKIGKDQTKAQSDAANPMIAATGATATVNLTTGAVDASFTTGKSIVDVAKCNACHDRLGTTFHTPDYGSAGTVGCRLCHWVGAGGSHLEMQSRSIDSYVHALHSMQPMDIQNVDFAVGAQKLHYWEHVDGVYPNFTTFNCESCHNKGTYEVPDQTKSLAGLLSKSQTVKGWDRNVGTFPSVVTGPGSRACGACHRAYMINEDDASKLVSMYAHQASFSTQLDATTNSTTLLEDAWTKIMALFK